MELETQRSDVYVQVDNCNRITRCNGGYTPLADLSDWILIDEGTGDKYNLCQIHYFPDELTAPDGTHRYIYDPSLTPAYREATAEELAAERAEIEAASYSLPDRKAARAAESKAVLAQYLEDHPLYWSDGRRYSVTMEKQSLLTSVLARYQIAAAAGQALELRWNATGEECTVWEYEALAALALDIAAYVETFVSRQQALEVEIMAAESREELEAIVIDYKTPEPVDPVEPETPSEDVPSVP